MRMFLGILSAVAFVLASRRFYLSESVGYDIGAVFLLLIGIQLFIGAAIFHEQHESRKSRPPGSGKAHEDIEGGHSGP